MPGLKTLLWIARFTRCNIHHLYTASFDAPQRVDKSPRETERQPRIDHRFRLGPAESSEMFLHIRAYMEPPKFIDYRGTEILLIDLSESTPEQILRGIEQSGRIIRNQPPQSVRTLTYVHRARYNRQVTHALKEYTKANKPHVRAAAVVGLSGLMELILQAIVIFTSRTFAVFDDLEEAKDWLSRN
jgi:hypothetical protein